MERERGFHFKLLVPPTESNPLPGTVCSAVGSEPLLPLSFLPLPKVLKTAPHSQIPTPIYFCDYLDLPIGFKVLKPNHMDFNEKYLNKHEMVNVKSEHHVK